MIRSLFLLSLFLSPLLHAQGDSIIFIGRNWLTPVGINLPKEGDPSDTALNIIDRGAKDKTIFISGEQHTHQGTMEMKMRLLFHLYEKSGVRLVIEELPYSSCLLMDHFMRTHNEKAFSEVVANTSHMAKESHYLLTLYHFNASHPADQQLVLRGVDREYESYYTVMALDTLFAGKTLPGKIKAMIDSAREGNESLRKAVLRRLSGEWTKEAATLREQFGQAYGHALCMLRSYVCEACYARGEHTGDLMVREQMLYENYLDVLAEHPGKKVFSQFGDSHVCLQPDTTWYYDHHWTSIASRLDKWPDSPVRGKVCSISVVFFDFNVYNPQTIPTPLLKGIWHYVESGADLLDVGDSLCPFYAMNGLVNYVLILDFGGGKESIYNANHVKNDPYHIMNRNTNIYNGVYIAGSTGYSTILEGGYLRAYQVMSSPRYPLMLGAGMEFSVDQKLHTYKAFVSSNALHLLVAGACLAYSTDYRESALFIRPELGVSLGVFQLVYSYNLALLRNTDQYIYTKTNTGMVTLRILLPGVQEW